MNEITRLLMSHCSVRSFKSLPVTEEIKKTFIQCGQMAPTSSNFQAYSIIDVQDAEKRKAIAASSGNQEWLITAPVVLLFCADLHRNERLFTIEDKGIFHNTESYTVAVIDAALAAQKTLIAAQGLGLGGVIVGGIRNDMDLLRDLFCLPELVMPLFALALGYPDNLPIQRPRLPYEVIVKQNAYRDEDVELVQQYDKEIREFFQENTKSQRDSGWLERCSYALGRKPRYEVTRFAKEQGFLKD